MGRRGLPARPIRVEVCTAAPTSPKRHECTAEAWSGNRSNFQSNARDAMLLLSLWLRRVPMTLGHLEKGRDNVS